MRLFLAASSSADSSNRTPTGETLKNCYAYPAPDGSLAPFLIRSVPATRSFSVLPGPFLRAVARVEDILYAVSAGGLYVVRNDGTSTFLAAIPDDPNTTIVGNRDIVCVVADGGYFIWDGAALTQPTGGAFDSMGSVAFLDQFTILSQLEGREWQWTEAGLPATLDGLFFASAEARDDKIIRIIDTAGYVAILKELSVELWGNSRLGAENAFQRIDGTVQDRGLRAFNLVTKTPDGIFYIADDDAAYLGGSSGAQRVSPPNVVTDIKAATPTHCFYYEDRGHQFHVIRFSDRPAWVFDSTTGNWHQRTSGVEHKPWDIITAVKCYGEWHLGSRQGVIYRLSTTPADADAPLRRTVVTRPLYADSEPFSLDRLEILGLFGNFEIEETAPNWLTDQHGFVLRDQLGRYLEANTQGAVETWKRPGRMWIRLSRDGGRSWGLPRIKGIGVIGQRTRAEWWSLGQYEHLTVEINLTDPVDVPLLSEAVVDVS